MKAKISCQACRYFRITWQPDHPYACEFFGFKSKTMPMLVVKATEGNECQAFSPKKKAPRQGA